MQRRDFIKIGLLPAVSPWILSCQQNRKILKNSKPNFLFLFADDLTYEAVGALNYINIETPNLDRLVRNGVTFTHAYNQGGWNGAICVASRTMLTTGRFLWHALNAAEGLAEGSYQGELWPQFLYKAGYDTYMSGKWDIDADLTKLFKYNIGSERYILDPPPEGYNRPHEGQPDVWKAWDQAAGDYWKDGKHDSEILAEEGIAFINQAAARENPFFMYLSFNAPHDPRQSPKAYVDRYHLDKVEVPENFLPLYPYKDHIGCGEDLRDERLAPFPRTEYAVRVHRNEYYAIITHLDTQIGRILDALENSGMADNTFVFFSSDNGLGVGHHGLMGKQNLYDHSVRVPLIMTGPNITRGVKISTPVYFQDIMPTTLELAGITKPDYVQFKSLMPLLDGRRDNNYDVIYGAYMDLQRMITKDGYKLIYYPKIEKTLLFDLNNDPQEMHDLAEKAAYKNKVAELKSALDVLQKEMGDPMKRS
jgi:arylsulfatase A-like enzyme